LRCLRHPVFPQSTLSPSRTWGFAEPRFSTSKNISAGGAPPFGMDFPIRCVYPAFLPRKARSSFSPITVSLGGPPLSRASGGVLLSGPGSGEHFSQISPVGFVQRRQAPPPFFRLVLNMLYSLPGGSCARLLFHFTRGRFPEFVTSPSGGGDSATYRPVGFSIRAPQVRQHLPAGTAFYIRGIQDFLDPPSCCRLSFCCDPWIDGLCLPTRPEDFLPISIWESGAFGPIQANRY